MLLSSRLIPKVVPFAFFFFIWAAHGMALAAFIEVDTTAASFLAGVIGSSEMKREGEWKGTY